MDKAWKIIKRSIKIFFIGLLVLIVGFIALLFYDEELRVQTVDTSTSSDGEYTLILQQVGQPKWPFGPVDAKIVLNKDGRLVEKIKTSVNTDGAQLNDIHWDVAWSDSKSIVTLTGESGSEVFTFELT